MKAKRIKNSKSLSQRLITVCPTIINVAALRATTGDAAQDYFRKFSDKLDELVSSNALNDKQKDRYVKLRDELAEELKGFTHKDQKPYWH